MKISKRLKLQIHQLIRGVLFEHTKVIDAEDRSERIPHESWRVIHKSAVEVMNRLPELISAEIEGYRK